MIIKIWQIGFVSLVAIIAMCFAYSFATKKMVVQAIEAGASPLEAECALTNGSHYCMILYAKELQDVD